MTTPVHTDPTTGIKHAWDGTQWQPLPTQPPKRKKHTGRNWVIGIVAAAVAIGVIGSVSAGGSKHNPSTPGPAAPTVGRGVGANDASADVKLTSVKDEGSGIASGVVTITNHSSKRSDYFVTVVFLDADGTQAGDGIASAMAVEPGQVARASLVGTTTGSWTKARVTDIQRTAS
jgi:hypothetical protein